jgi:penicillin-binding protein 1A
MTLREALTRSINTITVRLAQDVGMPAVIGRTARELGLTGDIPNTPPRRSAPLRCGRSRWSAYAAFSNGGYRCDRT